MMKLFIFYPKLFNSKTKFDRKLNNILKNTSSCEVYYFHDQRNFIKEFFANHHLAQTIQQISTLFDQPITHGIIFDDGEEFLPFYQEYLLNRQIIYRYIKIKITRVINIGKESQYQHIKSTPNFEYIGRGSYWGNPYSMYDYSDENNSRDDVIRKFKYDFDYDKFLNKKKTEVYKLAGKRLGCFCKPEKCHGDVLADFLNRWDDGH